MPSEVKTRFTAIKDIYDSISISGSALGTMMREDFSSEKRRLNELFVQREVPSVDFTYSSPMTVTPRLDLSKKRSAKRSHREMRKAQSFELSRYHQDGLSAELKGLLK